jgi:hypothetical protein
MLKTIRFAALVAGASLIAAPAWAQSSPVLGTWNTEAVTDFGTFKATMTVTEANGAYSIEMKDLPAEGAPPPPPPVAGSITEVAVNGSDFAFKRKLSTPQGEMQLAYAGKVDGDTLTAQVDTGGFGVLPVTGKRQ